jgi:hypothetical protein
MISFFLTALLRYVGPLVCIIAICLDLQMLAMLSGAIWGVLFAWSMLQALEERIVRRASIRAQILTRYRLHEPQSQTQ